MNERNSYSLRMGPGSHDKPTSNKPPQQSKLREQQSVTDHGWTAERLINAIGWNPDGKAFRELAKEINASLKSERDRHAYIESQRDIMSKMKISEIEQLRHLNETMPIKLFLSEIKPVISRATSIQGFIITTRTDKSTVQIKWGNNRIRKWAKK